MPNETRGGNACWLIGIDSVRSNCLGFPGFAIILVDSGSRKISTTPNSPIKIANGKFNFDFESGISYYFEYEALQSNKKNYVHSIYNTVYGVSFGWKLVPEAEALPKISELKAWHKN